MKAKCDFFGVMNLIIFMNDLSNFEMIVSGDNSLLGRNFY